MVSRRFQIAFVLGALIGAGGALSFAPIVRYEAQKWAHQHRALVRIDRVAPTSHGVRFQGVDVTLDDVPAATVHLDEVDVGIGFGPMRATFAGGVIQAIGAYPVILQQLDTLRAKRSQGATASSGEAKRSADIRGFVVRWQDSSQNPTQTLEAKDVSVVTSEKGIAISAEAASVRMGLTQVDVRSGTVDLTRSSGGAHRLSGLHAEAVTANVTLTAGSGDIGTGALVPSPSPLATAPIDSAGLPTKPVGPSVATDSNGPDRSAVTALVDGLLRGAKAVDLALDPSAEVRVDGLSARIQRGTDSLNLGPGVLRVHRAEGRLLVELAPEARPLPSQAPAPPTLGGAAPSIGLRTPPEETLTFRLQVPLGDAPADIAADLSGGPIWLSTLGVRDGDFGLFDVGQTSLSTRARVVLSANGKTVHIDGEGRLHNLSIRSRALSDEPVAGLEIAIKTKSDFGVDGDVGRIQEGEIDLGAIHLALRGEVTRVPIRGAIPAKIVSIVKRTSRRSGRNAAPLVAAPSPPIEDRAQAIAPSPHVGPYGYRIVGTFEVPLTGCQAMLDSTPRGIIPKLAGLRFAGSFALRGHADIDTTQIDRAFVLDWTAGDTCRIVEAPAAINVARFRKAFRHTAYDPEGRPIPIETGPGTPEWVPYSAISKFMETAVLTTEDGSFEHHHGFDHEAIRNSIRENLRLKKFIRGASTITMQLAKNLYLDRGKNLARKLQEAVLTQYLEQELTKEQILELYFNVIEFGPMIYGIGPAARHYFNTTAADLSLGQALYVSSIMPNPRLQHFGTGGAVTESWMQYLRKLMKLAHARHHLTDEELEEGLRETVVRGAPKPNRAAQAPSLNDPGEGEPQMPEPPSLD